MKSVKILQLGDVHYPDSKNAFHVDYKDKAIQSHLIDSLAPPQLQQVIRSILDISETEGADGILICGDLTSRGDLTQYGPCVDYLIRGLGLGADRWPEDVIHVVPGNHDINQSECDPTGADLFKKFAPLKKEWLRHGLPILASDALRETAITREDCSVHLYSMNSCIGCRERRSLPHPIEAQLKKVLDDYRVAYSPESFALIGEQLDTPAFLADHINAFMQRVKRLPAAAVPLVLAHHNVLPQALMRIDIYTEVINGGLVRSRMAAAERCIVYCHGHIHTDPIEMVTTPHSPGGGLLCVAAPELKAGFNLLEFTFANNSAPLGVSISHFRASPDGAVHRNEPLRVPFVKASDARHVGTDAMLNVLAATSVEWERFPAFLKRLRDLSHISHPAPHVANSLMEAEWFSLVDIDNRAKNHKHWSVRRIQP